MRFYPRLISPGRPNATSRSRWFRGTPAKPAHWPNSSLTEGSDSTLVLPWSMAGRWRAVRWQEIAGQFRREGAKNVLVEILPAAGDSPSELVERLTAQRLGAILLVGPAERNVISALVPMLAGRSTDLRSWPRRCSRINGWLPLRQPGRPPVHCLPGPSWIAAEAGEPLPRSRFWSKDSRVRAELWIAKPSSRRWSGFDQRIERGGRDLIRAGPSDRDAWGSAVRLAHGTLAYEVITARIDPGPTSDDWPDVPGVPAREVCRGSRSKAIRPV